MGASSSHAVMSRTSVPTRCRGLDQAEGLQDAQGLADDRAGHPELVGHQFGSDDGARGQVAVDDPLAQGVEHVGVQSACGGHRFLRAVRVTRSP